MALSGFARLVMDINEAVKARDLAHGRALEVAAEARDLWRACTDNSLFIKAVSSMVADMGDMSRQAAATAREMNIRRKAEGRQRLAALIAETDLAIAAGLITGEQGARLDAAIARVAEGLRE
jgi:hypothetical protein